jgi:hypothetical protein
MGMCYLYASAYIYIKPLLHLNQPNVHNRSFSLPYPLNTMDGGSGSTS